MTGCVIMASGLGRRFGGNKLMADFGGSPLLCRAFAATDGLFSCRVVVTRHHDVAQLCRTLGIEVLLHDLPRRSDTVRLGLQAVGAVEGCLFCPGDQPLLRRDTVERLLAGHAADGGAIWRPVWQDTAGSPVLFPRWTFPELLALPEGAGGSYVLRRHPEQVRTVPVAHACELADVDTPEDLALLLRQAQGLSAPPPPISQQGR